MAAQTESQSSTWTFSCVNHPHLRWTKTKCGGGFIGAGVLMFEGDAERNVSGGPFPYTEAQLDERGPEFKQHFLSRYAAECDCPASDLRVHAREYQPIYG